MSGIFKYFEYVYLIVAGLFAYEAYSIWGVDTNKAYFYLLFVAAALFMFFFRRRFRKRMQDRNDNR
ncbi:hypothetical protein [Croceiramulus getboli]|nr:hypothetical protein P8624_02230 [Flavobacteriaceae bacterium YJPT1-3]